MSCRTNSFVPATLVLMADGTTTPIADVDVGDMVMVSDPETGESGRRRVTDTIVGDGTKELVDIEIDGNVITATNRHPFWVDEGHWVDAEDSRPATSCSSPMVRPSPSTPSASGPRSDVSTTSPSTASTPTTSSPATTPSLSTTVREVRE